MFKCGDVVTYEGQHYVVDVLPPKAAMKLPDGTWTAAYIYMNITRQFDKPDYFIREAADFEAKFKKVTS